MTQAEAREILEKAMHAFQRYRGFSSDIGTGESWLSKGMWPWVYGEKCPLPAIIKMLDRDRIVPAEFYNIMFILDRFAPEIKTAGEIENIVHGVDFEFPTPDIVWLREGFEE